MTPRLKQNKSLFQSIKDKTLFIEDNYDVLQTFDDEVIDLIYIDPPFNSNRNYYDVLGVDKRGFDDTFRYTDFKEEWVEMIASQNPQLSILLQSVKDMGQGVVWESRFAYSVFMAIRIIELHRILKPTGSMYLHCDPTMSHFLKLVMDVIFGADNFLNEIVWGYRTGGASKRYWSKKHDIILFYQKTNQYKHKPERERIYYKKPFFTSKQDEQGRWYADVYVRDVWNDIKPLINVSSERTKYKTQKPLALLNRIIEASSNEGDIVLDAFCGCATALVSANYLNRYWIGIDKEEGAMEQVEERLQKDKEQYNHIQRTQEQQEESIKDPIFLKGRKMLPIRTENIVKMTDKEMKEILYGKSGGYCYGCRRHFEKKYLELDHIKPRSMGGQDDISNRVLLCRPCNLLKSNKSMAHLFRKLKEQEQNREDKIYKGIDDTKEQYI